MYLVELRPGKEELYRTSDELALAIRNGDVDARSRVYHRATAKWISITLHPQYKAIVTAAKDEPARPARRGWSILGGSGGSATPSGDGDTQPGHALYRWRRPLALGVAGLLLLSGLQLAFSGPRPPWAGKHPVAVAVPKAPPPARSEAARPAAEENTTAASELISLASNRTAWAPLPAESSSVVESGSTTTSGVVLPRAPRLRTKSLRAALSVNANEKVATNSLDALFARYSAAHDAAETRLETGMRVARLSRLFASPRLSPDGGVTDTRMSLAGVANFIHVYRQQQNLIEQAYQDSVLTLAKKQGWPPMRVRSWYSRQPRREAPTLQLISGSLLASIDSALGVLDAQAGAYKIRGSAIAFEDPTAGQRYGALRQRIKQQIDAAIAAGGATSSGPTRLLLQAIGTTTLPRET